MHGMSSKPITKVARNGFDARYCDDKDLAFSSEWKTPKIFKQTSESWENTLGYIPAFMGFRQLNSSVPFTALNNFEYISGGFDTTCFTHANPSLMEFPSSDGVTFFSDGNLSIVPFSGYSWGTNWADEKAFALLFLDPIYGNSPTTYPLKSGGVYLLGKGDVDVRTAFPSDNSMDSRFDSLKIFKTGKLELKVYEETFGISEAYHVYTAEFEHNLGYAPVYLPEAGVGWALDSSLEDDSFIVNDNLGKLPAGYAGINSAPVLDVYVDSDKLYLRLWRFANDWSTRHYDEVTITLYYTIFYNEIGEEFDLYEP